MKKCEYIIDKGVAYVPRPTSVGAGQARHVWLKKKLGIEVHIASPPVWQALREKFEVHVIEEKEQNEQEEAH